MRSLTILERRPKETAGGGLWVEMQRYPTSLLVYALGLAGVASGNLSTFLRALTIEIPSQYGGEPDSLSEWAMAPGGIGKSLELLKKNPAGGGDFRTPGSDYIYENLPDAVRQMFTSPEEYEEAFDDVEYLLSLAQLHRRKWAMVGRFWWRKFRHCVTVLRAPQVQQYRDAFVKSGLFENTDAFDEAVLALNTFVASLPLY